MSSVFQRPDSSGWHFDFRAGGQRFRGKAEGDDRRSAERWLKAHKASVKASLASGKPSPSMTMDDATERYWDEVGKHSREHDLEANLERLALWIGLSTPISEVGNDLLARLVARRRADVKLNARGGVIRDKDGRPVLVSASTVNRSVTELLRRIMTRARRVWEIALREPNWRDHILKEPEERVRELSFGEEDRLVGALRPDYRPIVAFDLIVGLRRRTLVDMTWSQVDWPGGQIRVKGKGDKWHTLPITPSITEVLWPLYVARDRTIEHVFTYTAERTRTCARSGREFVRGQRYPISYQGLATEVTRACKAAGIEDFRVHDQRHTAATRALRGSKSLPAVQRLLNHADVKTTMKYAHVLVNDVADALVAAARDIAARRSRHEEAVAATPHETPHAVKRMRTKGRKSLAKRAVE